MSSSDGFRGKKELRRFSGSLLHLAHHVIRASTIIPPPGLSSTLLLYCHRYYSSTRNTNLDRQITILASPLQIPSFIAGAPHRISSRRFSPLLTLHQSSTPPSHHIHPPIHSIPSAALLFPYNEASASHHIVMYLSLVGHHGLSLHIGKGLVTYHWNLGLYFIIVYINTNTTTNTYKLCNIP